MIKGLDKLFENAGEIQDLQKRSQIFEETLLSSIHAMESVGNIITNSKKIYDNEALKKTMNEADHVALATTYAANQMSWSDMNRVAEMHDTLRKLYTEIFKKDAITAASLNQPQVSLEKDSDGNNITYHGGSGGGGGTSIGYLPSHVTASVPTNIISANPNLQLPSLSGNSLTTVKTNEVLS